jgi:hypothetical protein
MKWTALLSAFAVSTTLFGDDQDRLTKLEKIVAQISTSTPRGNTGPSMASASFNINGFGFYVSADIVSYQLLENNNVYAYSSLANNSGSHLSYKTDFNWDVGFKTGFGYYSEHDMWQTGFEFTYFQTQNKSHATPQNQNDFIYISDTSMQNGYEKTAYAYAKDAWKVSFYNLDWTVGRDFYISRYLSILPNLGLKTAWFYQERKTFYTHLVSNKETTGAHFEDTYVGVGPKFDATFKFHLGKNFSLFGKLDAALLWATNKSNYHANSGNILFQNNQKPGQINPYIGTNLGFCYDTNFSSDRFNMSVKLSYEQQYYGSASRLAINDVPSFYNIALRGVDLGLLFQF